MGETTKFHLPFPEITDPANVPSDMEALAQAIEANMFTEACVLQLDASFAPNHDGSLVFVPVGNAGTTGNWLEQNDPRNMHGSSPVYTLKPSSSGIWIVTANVYWAALGGGFLPSSPSVGFDAYIRISTGLLIARAVQHSFSTNYLVMPLIGFAVVSQAMVDAGDGFELFLGHNSTNTINVVGNSLGTFATTLAAAKVSAL